jgi:hypothetical protein
VVSADGNHQLGGREAGERRIHPLQKLALRHGIPVMRANVGAFHVQEDDVAAGDRLDRCRHLPIEIRVRHARKPGTADHLEPEKPGEANHGLFPYDHRGPGPIPMEDAADLDESPRAPRDDAVGGGLAAGDPTCIQRVPSQPPVGLVEEAIHRCGSAL